MGVPAGLRPGVQHRAAWRERSIGFFTDNSVDLLLTPALAATPPQAEGWSRRSWQANMMNNIRYAPYAAPWNIAGLPSLVVPVGLRPDGLPVGVQLVGPPGSELLLLGVAGQFEIAAPGPGTPPAGPGYRSPRADHRPAARLFRLPPLLFRRPAVPSLRRAARRNSPTVMPGIAGTPRVTGPGWGATIGT